MYRIYLTFQDTDSQVSISELILRIKARSHDEAIKLALKEFDDSYAVDGHKLCSFNCYKQ